MFPTMLLPLVTLLCFATTPLVGAVLTPMCEGSASAVRTLSLGLTAFNNPESDSNVAWTDAAAAGASTVFEVDCFAVAFAFTQGNAMCPSSSRSLYSSVTLDVTVAVAAATSPTAPTTSRQRVFSLGRTFGGGSVLQAVYEVDPAEFGATPTWYPRFRLRGEAFPEGCTVDVTYTLQGGVTGPSAVEAPPRAALSSVSPGTIVTHEETTLAFDYSLPPTADLADLDAAAGVVLFSESCHTLDLSAFGTAPQYGGTSFAAASQALMGRITWGYTFENPGDYKVCVRLLRGFAMAPVSTLRVYGRSAPLFFRIDAPVPVGSPTHIALFGAFSAATPEVTSSSAQGLGCAGLVPVGQPCGVLATTEAERGAWGSGAGLSCSQGADRTAGLLWGSTEFSGGLLGLTVASWAPTVAHPGQYRVCFRAASVAPTWVEVPSWIPGPASPLVSGLRSTPPTAGQQVGWRTRTQTATEYPQDVVAHPLIPQSGTGQSSRTAPPFTVDGTVMQPYNPEQYSGVFGASQLLGGATDGYQVFFAPNNNGVTAPEVRLKRFYRLAATQQPSVAYLPPSVPTSGLLFAGVVYAAGVAWYVPSGGDVDVVRVDFASNKATSLDAWPQGLRNGRPDEAFFGGIVVPESSELWLLPQTAAAFVVVDTTAPDTTMTDPFEAPNPPWPSGVPSPGMDAFRGGVIDAAGRIWMIPHAAEAAVAIDTRTREVASYNGWPEGSLGGASDGGTNRGLFSGGTYDGASTVWFAPFDAPAVVAVRVEDGSMTSFTNWPLGFIKEAGAFNGAAFDGRNVWLIPHFADALVSVDTWSTDGGAMSAYSAFPASTNFAPQEPRFGGGVYDGQRLWLVPRGADQMVLVGTAPTVVANSAAGGQAIVTSAINMSVSEIDTWPAGFNRPPSFTTSPTMSLAYDGRGVVWIRPVFMHPFVMKTDVASGATTALPTSQWPAGVAAENASRAFSAVVFDGAQSMWLVPATSTYIVAIDTHTDRVTAIPCGVGVSVAECRNDVTATPAYTAAVGYDQGAKVWFAPGGASKFLSVRVATAELSTVDLPEGLPFAPPQVQSVGAFTSAVFDEIQREAWFIPGDARALVSIDESGTVRMYDQWPTGLRFPDHFGGAFSGAAIERTSNSFRLWLAPWVASDIVVFDLDGQLFHLAAAASPAGSYERFAGVVFDGSQLYFLPAAEPDILSINPRSGVSTVIDPPPGTPDRAGQHRFAGVGFDGRRLWLPVAGGDQDLLVIGRIDQVEYAPPALSSSSSSTVPSYMPLPPGSFLANANGRATSAAVLSSIGPINATVPCEVIPASVRNRPPSDQLKTSSDAWVVLDGRGVLWVVPSDPLAIRRLNATSFEEDWVDPWTANLKATAGRSFNGALYDGTRYIWMVPTRVPYVVRLDTEVDDGTMSIAVYSDSFTERFFSGGCVSNGILWFAPDDDGPIVGVDTSTNETISINWTQHVHGVSLSFGGFSGAVFDGNRSVYFYPARIGVIMHLDVDTRQLAFIAMEVPVVAVDELFSGAVFDGRRSVYLIPKAAHHILRLDTVSHRIERFGVPVNEVQDRPSPVYDGTRLFMVASTQSWIAFSPQSGLIDFIPSAPSSVSPLNPRNLVSAVFDGTRIWAAPQNPNHSWVVLGDDMMALCRASPPARSTTASLSAGHHHNRSTTLTRSSSALLAGVTSDGDGDSAPNSTLPVQTSPPLTSGLDVTPVPPVPCAAFGCLDAGPICCPTGCCPSGTTCGRGDSGDGVCLKPQLPDSTTVAPCPTAPASFLGYSSSVEPSLDVVRDVGAQLGRLVPSLEHLLCVPPGRLLAFPVQEQQKKKHREEEDEEEDGVRVQLRIQCGVGAAACDNVARMNYALWLNKESPTTLRTVGVQRMAKATSAPDGSSTSEGTLQAGSSTTTTTAAPDESHTSGSMPSAKNSVPVSRPADAASSRSTLVAVAIVAGLLVAVLLGVLVFILFGPHSYYLRRRLGFGAPRRELVPEDTMELRRMQEDERDARPVGQTPLAANKATDWFDDEHAGPPAVTPSRPDPVAF